MSIEEFCQWLVGTPMAVAIAEWNGLFAAIETVHVIALVLVVGSIFVVDLRLMGLASRTYPVPVLMREILPYTWTGFAVAAVSGALLFTSNAAKYYVNVPFRMKMLLLVLAGVNMLVFHLVTYRSVNHWGGQTPMAAKVAGGVSVGLWIGVVTFGRWIGYTIQPMF
jgi:hypothetical protein